MKEVDIISKVVGRDTSGKAAMYIPGVGAPSVNLDDYLLKKIWDSVFEIRTDGEGNMYLFEKLPFVTQYGITMYANGGDLNLPSIYAGLPIDNSTLIRDDNGVLMINPDIDLGGGASTLGELTNVGSWADSAPTQGRLLYQAAGSSVWSYKNVSEFVSETGAYLPLSGGNMLGHIFMTGAVENSSTANTSQIVFGTSAKNHVCLTSNLKGLIINPSLNDTSGQIALYADASMESFIQSSLKVYGSLYASVYFNYGGSIAQSYGSSMYVWDNNLQINKTTISNDYLKTIMSFDLINEDIAIKINGTLSLNSFILWNSDSNNPYMCIIYGGRNWYLQAYNNAYIYLGTSIATSIRIDAAGNLLTAGGITMYSDSRKKTKLQDVELSLQQIADAPLIEHYYNSDAMRTTHVGSIAQYWAGLNDWFCKLDSEGYYTMEIQNAALASAISIARELVKYESKTDRKIRLLKRRVKELEDKIEKLEMK